jgi:hypothetical protein
MARGSERENDIASEIAAVLAIALATIARLRHDQGDFVKEDALRDVGINIEVRVASDEDGPGPSPSALG